RHNLNEFSSIERIDFHIIDYLIAACLIHRACDIQMDRTSTGVRITFTQEYLVVFRKRDTRVSHTKRDRSIRTIRKCRSDVVIDFNHLDILPVTFSRNGIKLTPVNHRPGPDDLITGPIDEVEDLVIV